LDIEYIFDRLQYLCSETLVENKAPVFSEDTPMHAAAGFRSPWSGVPGQLSMADIVKMGRPQGRASSNVNSSQYHATASQAAPTPHELYSSQSYAPKVDLDSGAAGTQSTPDDDWPQDEQQPTLSMPSISEPSVLPEQYMDPSTRPFDGTKHHLDEVQYSEVSEADSRRFKMQDESSVNAPILNDELHDSISAYQADRSIYEQLEGEYDTQTFVFACSFIMSNFL